MSKRAKIGDIFEITTPAGLAYVQYTHDDPDMGELVRVLPGLYVVRPDIARLAQQKELYFIFYILKLSLRQGQIQLASREPVPEWAKPFPTMRHHGLWNNSWYIGDRLKKKLKVKELTPEQQKLSISSLLRPHPAMVKALALGWMPEHDVGFDWSTVAKGNEEVQVKENREKGMMESKPEFLDHYLYFPKKSDAQQATQRVRAKGWSVEVQRGADGKNWLTLAKQPTSIDDDIEEIRDELERLAKEFGGEYDGWGANIKGEPSSENGKK